MLLSQHHRCFVQEQDVCISQLWVLNQKILEEINCEHPENSDIELEKITNRFISNVEHNIETFSYNKIIANFHETYSLLNNLIKNKIDKVTWTDNYKKILITMSPVIPHFANECLSKLKIKNETEENAWPKINKNILIENKVNFVIQINGKKRGVYHINKDTSEKDLIKKINDDQKLKNFIANKSIKNTIFIPNKLVNIIVAD